ncbi:amidase [soil metagenome]
MTTIAELQDAYRSGQLSPQTVADRFLAADPVGGRLGSFRSVDADDVLQQARTSAERLAAGRPAGPLEGILIGVKDFIAVRGYRSYAGTRSMAAHGDLDAVLVTRLRDAGAIIAGKTHCTELGLSPVGPNMAAGTPRNPHSPGHLTGGSSSGTGAAVSAGLVTGGVGSDGGGSIRIPAALCGVYGIKPSWQVVSNHGEMNVGWWSIEHIGPLARSTADLVTLLSVMADVRLDIDEAPLRFGVDWTWWGQPDPLVDAACRSVVAELEPRSVTLPHIELAPVTGYVTALTELTAGIYDTLRDRPQTFSVDVLAAVAQAPSITGVDYVRAQMARQRLTEAFDAAFEQVDVLLVPTVATPAPVRPSDADLLDGVVDADLIDAMTAYTFPANLCGLPAASVPIGTTPTDHLPIGLQVVGRRGGDATVLAACAALERAGLSARPRPLLEHDTLTPA